MRRTIYIIAILAILTIGVWSMVGVLVIGEKVATGQVANVDTGEPVSGATVRLGQLRQVTDVNGRFRLAGLRRSHRLVVEADGYYSQVQPVDWVWWQKVTVANLALRPARLTGVVVDAWTAQPLADAEGRTGGRVFSADATGRFTLTGLVPPSEIAISAPGYLAWNSVIASYQSLAHEADWTVALAPNTVTGTLQAADSREPLPGVIVASSGQRVMTDGSGRFRLHRVEPGDSFQIIPPEIFLPIQLTYGGGGELQASVEPRRLIVTAHDGLMDIPLPGTVVRGSGFSRTITTDGAEITRIAPGTPLQLTREGYLTTEVLYQGEARLDVAMRPYAVQGVVRDGDTGRPVPGATLYADDQILQADASGRYHIPELPSDLQVTVKAAGYRKVTLSLAASAVHSPALDVRLLPCILEPPVPGPMCLDLELTPFHVQGIYIPFGLLSEPDQVRKLLDLVERTELNALVVDVKGDRGYLAYESQVPLAVSLGVSSAGKDRMSIDELLGEAKARGIYTIARLVVFKDNPLAFGVPELAVQRADGTVWTDGEGLGWGNPFREEVWDYNTAIAQEAAALGFDEVQFDYLRFPSDGDIGSISYAVENSRETRTAAIREFTRRVTDALRPYGVFTSADVFGLTVWVDPDSDMSIGQRVIDVAPLVDYLCPMVYPSTFRAGNLGYHNPSAHPYDVIYRSQQAAEARVPAATRVRPWLQAYWYTLNEMLLQRQAADEAGASGWTFWNAGGVYEEALFEPD